MADEATNIYNSLDNTAMALGLGESDEAKRKREKAKLADGKKKPKAPLADDITARAKRERSASRRFSAGGRASTMLTGDDKLG